MSLQTVNGEVSSAMDRPESRMDTSTGACREIAGPGPLISIVLPTHNRAHLITESIESVLTQTYTNWDLIIVDDNSTDNTQEVIWPYLESDPRIRFVFNETHSHSCAGARNRGIDEICGEFAAFIDSDDTWPDYHLEELLGHLLANPDLDWIFGDLRRARSDGRVTVESKFRVEWGGLSRFRTESRGAVHVFPPDELVENVLRYGIQPGLQSSLLRSRLFSGRRLREVPVVDDILFFLGVAEQGCRVGCVDRIHLNYLVHENNLSAANLNPGFDQLMRLNEDVERYWTEYVPSAIAMTPERRRIVRKQLADHLVWGHAYNVLRPAGRKAEAARCIVRAIGYRPWKLSYWLTLAGTLVK